MPLQSVVDTLDAIPEAIRDAYVERDGKFHLNSIDGFVSKSKLDEFRDNNIAARKELDALRKQFEGVDPEKFREFAELDRQKREKKLLDAGELEKVFEERIGPMRSDHEKKLAAVIAERDAATKRLDALLIDDALRAAALKAGVLPAAADDVLFRGRSVFRLTEGKATAYKGENPLYGKNGEPVTIDEWVSGLSESAPHLFAASTGGKAPNNANQGGTGAKTMTRAQWDALPAGEKANAARNYKIV
jgi:hypothetical protein